MDVLWMVYRQLIYTHAAAVFRPDIIVRKSQRAKYLMRDKFVACPGLSI